MITPPRGAEGEEAEGVGMKGVTGVRWGGAWGTRWSLLRLGASIKGRSRMYVEGENTGGENVGENVVRREVG